MLEILDQVEKELPQLLVEGEWQSLCIDYHPPVVERLWMPWVDYRIYLHRIHPCEDALFHPHPWPSAVSVLEGKYEMAVGYGKEKPPFAAKLISDGKLRYEMINPDGWHYVRPIGGPSLSVMVTGKPWARVSPRSLEPLRPLSDVQRADLLQAFRRHFPGESSDMA